MRLFMTCHIVAANNTSLLMPRTHRYVVAFKTVRTSENPTKVKAAGTTLEHLEVVAQYYCRCVVTAMQFATESVAAHVGTPRL